MNDLNPHIDHLYDAQLNRLPGQAAGCYIDTAEGPVWLMQAGPEDGPVLLALHGMHTPAPFNLEMVWPLTRHYRVLSPDFPGHTGRTAGDALSAGGHAYGRWVLALLDRLDIQRCPMVGISFGAAVLLDTVALAPHRVGCASLIVPAGLEKPFWRPMRHIIVPWIRHCLKPSDESRAALLRPVMAPDWPALFEFYQAALRYQRAVTQYPPGPHAPVRYRNWTRPVQLILARQDIYFDAGRLARQAGELLPGFCDLLELDDTHIPSLRNRLRVQKAVVGFMSRYDSFRSDS
ncbi:alpha/beta fold hydrolase [Marinobacterium jannaschii]|uniref:alpha/beta fold hydrolase n=1 Tax=Marinobacterium jannaschii TaxID=64970 RepID=UPI000480803E|nr:alpha/beta hydrolase [Marinobacterium jannaschii]